MGREHPTDTLWRAQELYCVDRLSYAAVAEATGVSATTLKAWGQKYGWARRREEIARAESEIRVNIIKGRQKALEQLLAAADAKEAAPMAFAVSSLESLALKRLALPPPGSFPTHRLPRGASSPRGRAPWPPCEKPWSASWGWPLPTRTRFPRPRCRM